MIEKRGLMLFVVCCTVFCIQAKMMKPINSLRKAYYYDGQGQTDNGIQQGQADNGVQQMSIDLGKIVLVFNKKPIMNLLPSRKKSMVHKKLSFFFPRSSVENVEAQKMVKVFNSMRNKHYVFHLQQVKSPIPGLMLSISYDSSKVSLEHMLFDTIKSEKGILFTFHNQELLNILSKKQKGLVRVAAVKKKEQSLLTVDMAAMILGPSVVLV